MDNKQKILNYYNSLGSALGYSYLTWRTKHFGFYPEDKLNISEREAQHLMEDKIAENLKLTPKDNVLDAGCGYGAVACYIAKKYRCTITGIDINDRELGEGRKRVKKEQIKNVTFKKTDYSHTNFQDSAFNAIYTMETLSHAIDVKNTLYEFHRILKSGGRIALFEYTLAPLSEFNPWQRKMLDFVIEGTCLFGLKQFKQNQFKKLVETVGFTKVTEQIITNNMLPSLRRLHTYSIIPYYFIKLFGLQKKFPNITWGAEWYNLYKTGLIRYSIFTAQKL